MRMYARGVLPHNAALQIWMLILRYAAGLMVWLTLISVNVALAGVTLYSFSFAGLLDTTGVGKVRAVTGCMPERW